MYIIMLFLWDPLQQVILRSDISFFVFVGSAAAGHGPFHQVNTCEKIKFKSLSRFVDKNRL